MKLHKTLLAGGATCALLIGSQAAFATSTVSVNGTTTPAGDVAVTGIDTTGISFLSNFGVPWTCTGATATGYVKRGTSATSGTQVGAISSLTFNSGCLFTSLNFPVTLTKRPGADWRIFLDGTPAKGASTINVEIRNIYAQMTDTARTAPNLRCAVNAQGNVAGTTGATVKGRIVLNSPGTTDSLVINTPSLPVGPTRTPLVLDGLDGSANPANTSVTSSCGGEIQDGDLASMVGTFALNQQVAIS